MNIDMNDVFRSRFMKAADLQGREVSVQIESVEMEEIGETRETKPVVYFKNHDRPLVLNKTNAMMLSLFW